MDVWDVPDINELRDVYLDEPFAHFCQNCGPVALPHKAFTVPYKAFTVPYKAFTVSYKAFTVPYKAFTVPYKAFTVPYKAFTVPYKAFTVPYKALFLFCFSFFGAAFKQAGEKTKSRVKYDNFDPTGKSEFNL